MRTASYSVTLTTLLLVTHLASGSDPETRMPQAQTPAPTGVVTGMTHEHTPIVVPARPIVARYRAPLLQPRRVLIAPNGDLYIADWGAGRVLRITPNEDVHIIAENLDQPAGLALDMEQRLYIAIHAGGVMESGSVVRANGDGGVSPFAKGLTGPTSLAFDSSGQLFVANMEGNNVSAISPNGDVVQVSEISHPGAVFVSNMDELLAVSSTEGILYRLEFGQPPQPVVTGLKVPSDIAENAKGQLIVASSSGTELTFVDTMEEVGRPFALVPKGTVSLAFDASGNLIIANWDLRVVTKITTNLSVPCPHCAKPIPLLLKPKPRTTTESAGNGPLL